MRPPSTPAAIWPFSARTPVGDKVELQMASVSAIAPIFEAIIRVPLASAFARVRAFG